MKSPSNIAASVRQRLLNIQRQDGRPFSELLQYYAMERFLYRLSCSPYADCFIVKGALMLRVWGASQWRPTMDIDMLGKTSNEAQKVEEQIREIITAKVPDDGMLFDAASLRMDSITEDADYEGIRILFKAQLGAARVKMQLDIGFGDIVYPEADKRDLPTLLDFPSPELLCYSRESTIAEKFEAMISLGVLNSRMKDFYDIWILSRQFDFSGNDLLEAIRLTTENRGTDLNGYGEVFSEEFAASKEVQWMAFRKRMKQAPMPEQFSEVLKAVEVFLYPIVHALIHHGPVSGTWQAPGSWKKK